MNKIRLADIMDPSLRLPDFGALDKAANDVAAALAKKKDALISACITERLGHSSWNLHAIAHRVGRYRINDGPSETWTLDRVPMVEIWPATSKTVLEGDRHMLTWSFNHRTFPKDTPPLP